MVLMMDVVTAAQLISLNIKLDMYIFIGLTKYLKRRNFCLFNVVLMNVAEVYCTLLKINVHNNLVS